MDGFQTIPQAYDTVTVAISVIIAILSSYVALQLIRKTFSAPGWSRKLWLLAGSVVLGSGIWAMHFLGMQALKLPVEIRYDVAITIASLMLAIVSSAFALSIANLAKLTRPVYAVSGMLMGAGIAGMHYTGMMALHVQADMRHDHGLVALSIVIAILGASAVLRLVYLFRDAQGMGLNRRWSGVAALMGLTISSMHYVGMAAIELVPNPEIVLPATGTLALVGTQWMVAATALGLMLTTLYLARPDSQPKMGLGIGGKISVLTVLVILITAGSIGMTLSR